MSEIRRKPEKPRVSPKRTSANFGNALVWTCCGNGVIGGGDTPASAETNWHYLRAMRYPQTADTLSCPRCKGSGEDPEGYTVQGRGPDAYTVDGPCRDCRGSGINPN